jgi:hypothetical protein
MQEYTTFSIRRQSHGRDLTKRVYLSFLGDESPNAKLPSSGTPKPWRCFRMPLTPMLAYFFRSHLTLLDRHWGQIRSALRLK